MKFVPREIAEQQNVALVAESIAFRAKANQAAFAGFFLALGNSVTVVFMFALEAFNAPHRLICACRMRSRPSALILQRFLVS
jgi:hypothetical protein